MNMKNLLFIATIILAMSTNTTALATNGFEERGAIQVSTSANTEMIPDIAEFKISITTTDTKSIQKATEENKLISDRVYSTLTQMINKGEDEYIKTSNYNASPIYSYQNGKKIFNRYQVTNNFTVHTKDIQNIGKLIDKAIELGATNVDNLNFSISSYDKQCNDLLAIATNKAYERANILAKSANSTLNGIKRINGSCSSVENNTYRMLAKNTVSFGSTTDTVESASTPVQAGIIKVYANLTAEFFVK